MIEAGVIGVIVFGLWLSNSTVTHKEDTEMMLCVGVCVKTEAASVDGNTHGEHNPSVLKVLNDTIPAIGPQQEK
jgi:hypothetical protein